MTYASTRPGGGEVTQPQDKSMPGGSELDFDALYQEYRAPIYKYLLRMTQNPVEAEDLSQETFLRVNKSLKSFRGDANPGTWIYRIATNTSIDHFRKKGGGEFQVELSAEEAESVDMQLAIDDGSPTDNLAAKNEMSDCVQSFIGRLQPGYRTVLVLHDLQGLKNREIADVLDCSLDSVKIRLHRARKKLQEALDKGCDFSYDERNVFICQPTDDKGKTCG
jgi:RNA polymerase sigma-70 factor (ECF subfamily)